MKLIITLQLIACCFLAHFPEDEAFLFRKKTDCSVSSWSAWGAPVGFGTVVRKRVILKHPVRGGKDCPPLRETNSTTAIPTIKATATSVKDHFVRRQGQVLSSSGKSVGLKRDILVIIDSSGSIGGGSFNIVKDQIARLLGLLCPSPDPFSNNIQRAALIEYSSIAKVIFDFDDYSFTSQVQAGIKGMSYMGQSTCTATAFRLAHGVLTPARGMRTDPDVKQEVLILTDGQSNCGGNAIAEAHNLQNKADVFGLMIGNSFSPAGKAELASYVSGPIDQHLFAIQGFQDLTLLLDEVISQLNQPGAPPCVPFDI